MKRIISLFFLLSVCSPSIVSGRGVVLSTSATESFQDITPDEESEMPVPDFLNFEPFHLDIFLNTEFAGVYYLFDYGFEYGITKFYFIPKGDHALWYEGILSTVPENITDPKEKDIYIKARLAERSFSELSEDFDILVYHVSKEYIILIEDSIVPDIADERFDLVFFIDYPNNSAFQIAEIRVLKDSEAEGGADKEWLRDYMAGRIAHTNWGKVGEL